MNTEQLNRGDELTPETDLYFGHLHEQKGILTEPWLLDFKRKEMADTTLPPPEVPKVTSVELITTYTADTKYMREQELLQNDLPLAG